MKSKKLQRTPYKGCLEGQGNLKSKYFFPYQCSLLRSRAYL